MAKRHKVGSAKALGGSRRPKYKEEETLRSYLKSRAISKGKRQVRDKPDPRLGPYMYFFRCLGDQETSIQKILEIIAEAELIKEKAARELKAKPKISPEFAEIFEEMHLEDTAISHEEVQDVFAGTLFVLLNSLLSSMSARVHTRGGSAAPKSAGRKIGRTSLLETVK